MSFLPRNFRPRNFKPAGTCPRHCCTGSDDRTAADKPSSPTPSPKIPVIMSGFHQNKKVFDREYFFLGWLYPIVMHVNEAFHHDNHLAESAHSLLQDLRQDRQENAAPFIFGIHQGQFIRAVSCIQDVSDSLMACAKDITMENLAVTAPLCEALLEPFYKPPSPIFSHQERAKQMTGRLQEMRQALFKKYRSEDSTLSLLRTLLHPEHPDKQSVCLALAMLFERLHGRVQREASYVGRVLRISGGPILESVDDQDAWEHLTTVILEDMERIAALFPHPVIIA
jgi:hypothetical protein